MIATESRGARHHNEVALGGDQDRGRSTDDIRKVSHHRPQNKLGCLEWSLSRAAPPLAPPLIPVPLTRSPGAPRSEEHTSELQSRGHLVCRLLLEKKKHKTRKRIVAK